MTVYSTFFRRGQPAAGASVTLAPAEVRWIRLTDLDGSNDPGVKRNDGLELSYLGTMLEIGAQLTLTSAQGGSADVPFSMPGDYASPVQEAVWPTSPGVRAIVELANATDNFVVANVERPGMPAEEVRLPPRSTVTLPDPPRREGREVRPGVDWMRLTSRGAIGSVRATGLLELCGRLVGSVRFYDPAVARQSDLYATNLPLSGSAPVMVLKNTSHVALSAMPMFIGPDGDVAGAITLPAVLLGPGAASVVDLSPLVQAAATGTIPDHVSVQVQSTGAPGALIGSLLASRTGHLGVSDVPLRDTGPVRQSTGSYPWRIDGDYTTLVSITNVSDRPARFLVRIAVDGGEYAPNIPELAAHASTFFDLRTLRDQGVPDRKGRTIPGQATHGQFHWSILMSGGETKLMGRADVFSRRSGRRSSYSCPDCCPDSFTGYSYLDPGSLNVLLGNTNDVIVISQYQDCYQNLYETSANSLSAYWNVEQPNVTSVSNVYYGLARAQGNEDGGTGISGLWTEERFWFHADYCELEQQNANVAGQVQVMCPQPTNFRETKREGLNGVIAFEYRWDSTTGNTAHLNICTVRERVTYSPYPFPSPPFASGPPTNPYIVPVPASDGFLGDEHTTAVTPPFSSVTVNGSQVYEHNCRCNIGDPQWIPLLTPFGGIVRVIEPNGSGGWKFTISKSGLSSTKNPL
jgi:hypothetical protein